jgi:hypothetical protein
MTGYNREAEARHKKAGGKDCRRLGQRAAGAAAAHEAAAASTATAADTERAAFGALE